MSDDFGEWESWFAWHPIVVDNKWVWWEPVERRVVCYGMETFIWYRKVTL